MKILNNIGVAFIKLGEYEEAANTFGYCMEERADYGTALNLILTAYCLENVDKMKESFQQLVDIPRFVDDEPKYIVSSFNCRQIKKNLERIKPKTVSNFDKKENLQTSSFHFFRNMKTFCCLKL